MKKQFLVSILISLGFISLFTHTQAQSVTIDPKNTATALINSVSTVRGVIMPNMSEVQRNNSVPLAGAQVFCTNCAAGTGPYSYSGSYWIPMFDTGATAIYAVGQTKQGGIVFYVDATGQHGLVAATADQSTGIAWLNTDYTYTTAVRTGIYGGQYNTELINANQGSGSYAALIAAQYTGSSGFGDWYLPSKDELNLMYQLRATIGGFGAATYWSSTEVPVAAGQATENAYIQNFSSGAPGNGLKSDLYRVRAIRRF